METFRLIACPSISHEKRTDTYCEPGRTVGDYLREIGWKTDGLSARVFIDGELIPDAEWLTAEPQPGQAVIVRTIPQGGGGSRTGKQIGQMIGMLAVVLASAFVPGAAAGMAAMFGANAGTWAGIVASSRIISGIVTVAGALAMNARLPKPLPRLPETP